MCGICGTVTSSVPIHRVVTAARRMAHRGPDDEGLWQRGMVALAHRRLSIIDLSAAARQPISNEDGTVWLVFNGEIYNFEELRSQLRSRHRFKSRADTEVLLHGYEEWGIDGLLRRIRGMFAFAIWDEVRAELHLVRDHVGKKPLFYSTIGGGLTFASTLSALLEMLGETPPVSLEAVGQYLTYMCVPAPLSIFEGIFKLPPAHRLRMTTRSQPELVRYWAPSFAHQQSLSETEWFDRIDETFTSAVRDRMVADVPLGAFLSGGVDSSLVVAKMAQLSSEPVTTVSIGFDEGEFDELPYARKVADKYNTRHYEHVLRPHAASMLPGVVHHYGEPFGDQSALATYCLSRVARQYVTVVMTGDGGDENFAGYHQVVASDIAQLISRLPFISTSRLSSLLTKYDRLRMPGLRQLRWVCELARHPNGHYVFDPVGARTFRFFGSRVFGPALRGVEGVRCVDSLYLKLWNETGSKRWADRALYVDMLAYLPNDLLVKTDVASMAFGLEARSPFLDIRLIELTTQIPSSMKLKRWSPKYLLKKYAEQYVPKDVLYRRKQGFALPIAHWLRGELHSVLQTVLLSETARNRGLINQTAVKNLISEHKNRIADHSQRLWLLLMLELWFMAYVDKSLAPEDELT